MFAINVLCCRIVWNAGLRAHSCVSWNARLVAQSAYLENSFFWNFLGKGFSGFLVKSNEGEGGVIFQDFSGVI